MPSLTIDKSLLFPDIKEILKTYEDPKYDPFFTVYATLHTEEKDLDNSDGITLNSIQIVRNYVDNIADYMEVQLSLHLGTFIYDVYKFLDNIEVTLMFHKQLYQGKKPFIVKERYKAIYILDKNAALPNAVNQSKEDLNQELPVTITLQLLDRSAETIRIKTTQGNFDKRINPKNTDMSIKAFFRSIFSEEPNKILIENQQPLDYIDIQEPDNSEELKALNIMSKTRIIEIPEYIQTENIGVYNSGIGCYIQKFGLDHYTYKKILYIYSLYDPKRYDDVDYKLIFFVPISSSFSTSESTYKYEDKILKILPHYMSKFNDRKETNMMSTGSGFRISNSNSYMKKPVIITEAGPEFSRNGLDTEIVYKERKDNLNFSPNRNVSTNNFELSSEILKKEGQYITMEVTNLDPDFIYPGAPCKINYEKEDHTIKEIYGVIHVANISFRSTAINMPLNYSSPHVALTCHMALQIFISSLQDEE